MFNFHRYYQIPAQKWDWSPFSPVMSEYILPSPTVPRHSTFWPSIRCYWQLTVNSVRFVISKEEDLASGPGARLADSRAFVSVQFTRSVVSDSLWPHELQHARTPCPSPTPKANPNPCPLSRWCRSTISSSVAPFSSCPQSFSASGSFQMSQLLVSGGQSIGVSASTSDLQMNTQDWSPVGWTGWISLQSKGLSRVLTNATVQKHQFLCTQLSL